MIKNKIRSSVFVTVQFICLIAIAVTGEIIPKNKIYLLLTVLLFIPVIWAAILMRRKINVFPDLRSGAEMLTQGIYRYIRHPMYLSVLGVSLILVINDFSLMRFIIWIILTADLILKMNYEEKLLSATFKNYSEYKNQTKRLIPFIY